jgi:hypothetical protein
MISKHSKENNVPSKVSYLNSLTGEKTKVRPVLDAEVSPLPRGWLEVPSNRWPGKSVYLHVARTDMRLSWRPRAADPTDNEPVR